MFPIFCSATFKEKKTILPAHKVFGLTNHVRLSVLWSYIATRVFVVSENVYENR